MSLRCHTVNEKLDSKAASWATLWLVPLIPWASVSEHWPPAQPWPPSGPEHGNAIGFRRQSRLRRDVRKNDLPTGQDYSLSRAAQHVTRRMHAAGWLSRLENWLSVLAGSPPPTTARPGASPRVLFLPPFPPRHPGPKVVRLNSWYWAIIGPFLWLYFSEATITNDHKPGGLKQQECSLPILEAGSLTSVSAGLRPFNGSGGGFVLCYFQLLAVSGTFNLGPHFSAPPSHCCHVFCVFSPVLYSHLSLDRGPTLAIQGDLLISGSLVTSAETLFQIRNHSQESGYGYIFGGATFNLLHLLMESLVIWINMDGRMFLCLGHFLKNKHLVIFISSCVTCTSYLTSLGISFFICKIGIILIVPIFKLTVRIK